VRFLSHLEKLSLTSKHHRYRHAAILAKGKRIFASCTNSPGHHAEINAIVEAGANCKGATLYTLMTRVNGGGLGNGAPCPECMEALGQNKVKRVILYF
jgi:pyrimidine deaminase RibD-like protein